MTRPEVLAAPPRLSDLPAYLAHHARLSPGREAARDSRGVLSYAELDHQVSAFARALSLRGVGAGQCVAFQGPPGLPFWVSLLGTQRAGAAWLGLNPTYTARELAHVLHDAGPVIVLTALEDDAAGLQSLQSACAALGLPDPERMRGLALDGGPATGSTSRNVAIPPGVALIVYTSGSTGAPKGALLTALGLIENGWWLAARMGFAPLRGLVNLPVNHVGCVGDLCATLLVAGGTAVFMERFDAVQAVRRIAEERIEWLPQVPAQFQLMMARGGLDATALRAVRHLTWGGAAMPAPLVRQLQSWVPDLFNSYGLTECSGTITLTPPGATREQLTDTVGIPVAAGRLRIADGSGTSAGAGEVGEVQLHGPHVFSGYLGQPEATERAFTPDGWLRTGDLGQLDADGNLRLRGRTHEMFKSGGYNVYPREVEAVIESMTGVQLCAVVATPDPVWGEVGVAFVQGDATTVSPACLKAHCEAALARYKIPKRFIVLHDLPLLPIGKVDKAALQQEARQHGDG